MEALERIILDAEAAAISVGHKAVVVIDAEKISQEDFKELALRFNCHCYHPFEKKKSRNYFYFDYVSPFFERVTVRVKHHSRFRREFKNIEI